MVLVASVEPGRADLVMDAVTKEEWEASDREGLSSSRIRAIVNAARSLYKWAIAREKAALNPTEDIRLPAPGSEERDRIATPGEFAVLLKRPHPAGFTSLGARRVRHREAPGDPGSRMARGGFRARRHAARRRRRRTQVGLGTPARSLVKPLRRRFYDEWARQGEPKAGKVCPPRAESKSGLLSLNQLSKNVAEKWINADLRPIDLQDSPRPGSTTLASPRKSRLFHGSQGTAPPPSSGRRSDHPSPLHARPSR